MEKDIRRENALSNEAYKERFQFLLSIIDNKKDESVRENVICQRYFRINGFNSDSLSSVELHDVLESCVEMIKDDLRYKSFVYETLVSPSPLKTVGFAHDYDTLTWEDILQLTHSDLRGTVVLSNGETIEKEYIDMTAMDDDAYIDTDILEPWEVVFKFEFLVDDRPVFQKIWDGTLYQKQVRNSVDLSNSSSNYDPDRVSFNSMEGIMAYLKAGRRDLVNAMIRRIVEISSGRFDDANAYTKKVKYGDKTYWLSLFHHNRQQINSYNKWTAAKTRKYEAALAKAENNSERGGLTQSEWDYIERYL